MLVPESMLGWIFVLVPESMLGWIFVFVPESMLAGSLCWFRRAC